MPAWHAAARERVGGTCDGGMTTAAGLHRPGACRLLGSSLRRCPASGRLVAARARPALRGPGRAPRHRAPAWDASRHCCGGHRAHVVVESAAASNTEGAFQPPKQPAPLERAVGDLPLTAFYAASIAVVAASGGLGALLGGLAPGKRMAPPQEPAGREAARTAGRAVGAALGLAAGTFALGKLRAARATAAGIALYNDLASRPDAATLTREQVVALGRSYGVDLAKAQPEMLKLIYDTFLAACLPPGDAPLIGDEADRLRAFKAALGLADDAAAAVHLDFGRRLTRGRLEGGSRAEEAEQRRALQKLIYVSALAFGEQKAAFLLPWRRLFGLTDAQLYVARRDNAKALFEGYLASHGGELRADSAWLRELRVFQEKVRLDDDVALECVRDAARAHVEARLEAAIAVAKRRTRVRDYAELVQEVRHVLQYSRDLAHFGGEPGMPAGLGRVTIYGGRLEADNRSRELRDVYRIYLEERMRTAGVVDADLERDAEELVTILALGQREAGEIRAEVTARVYRNLLREEVSSGRLDAAPSKAAVLDDLCTRLHFDVEAAGALHRQLYRQKLDSLLVKQKLTDADVEELDRLRRLLVIRKDDVRQLHRETCGRIYQQAVEDALRAGIDAFGQRERDEVKAAQTAVRLDAGLAREVLGTAARKAFLGFITRSRGKRDRLEAAKELKKLVFFSNIVVAPLLEDIRADEDTAAREEAAAAEETKKELAAMLAKAQDTLREKEKEKKAAEEGTAAAADAPTGAAEAGQPAATAAEPAPQAASDAVPAVSEDALAEAAAQQDEAVEKQVEDAGTAAATPEPIASSSAAVSEVAASSEAPSAGQKHGAAEATEAAGQRAEGEAAEAAGQGAGGEPGDVQPATLRKSQAAAAERAGGEEVGDTGVKMRSQKEITLAGEIDLRERLDIYRNFLLFCMTGEVVALPMGSTVVVERSSSEFARLAQLGDILGLTPVDIARVHGDLAETAFRNQVQQVMADGAMTKERAEQLNEMRDKLGLSPDAAARIIKGLQSQRLLGGLQAQKASGQLTLQSVLDMRDAGVDVAAMTSEDLRSQLYSKEVAAALSDGTGNFDAGRWTEEVPVALGLPAAKVQATLDSLARDRRRTVLVQAVSYLRQKKLDEAFKAVNNLLACSKAAPGGEPASWGAREELQDLFSAYVSREADESKQSAVASLLGISADEAASLRELVAAGSFKLEQEAEEEAFF